MITNDLLALFGGFLELWQVIGIVVVIGLIIGLKIYKSKQM